MLLYIQLSSNTVEFQLDDDSSFVLWSRQPTFWVGIQSPFLPVNMSSIVCVITPENNDQIETSFGQFATIK